MTMNFKNILKYGYAKSLYNDLFREYRIKDEELKKLQKTLKEILFDFNDICQKYGIKYSLSDGSLLGAVRHEGFIPWDDDIDIMMTRAEYNKFVSVWNIERNNSYILVEPNTENYFYFCPKLLKNDTTCISVALGGLPRDYLKIGIDIFIVEYVPDNRLIRFLSGKTYKLLYFIWGCCRDWLYPSPIIMKAKQDNSYLNLFYGTRRYIGRFFCLYKNIDSYKCLAIRIISKYQNTKLMCPICDSIDYTKAVFSVDMFKDVINVPFEGRYLPVPKRYNEYLFDQYGSDYMLLPPEEKREQHLVAEINF